MTSNTHHNDAGEDGSRRADTARTPRTRRHGMLASRRTSPRTWHEGAAARAGRVFETLNDLGRVLSAELNLRAGCSMTDAATILVRAHSGFFYNVLDAGGASTCCTRSRCRPPVLRASPMPRATALFGPTFRGEEHSLNDVTQSGYGQNGPHHGCRAATRFCAVICDSGGQPIGEVLGVSFSAPGGRNFTESDERIIAGLAVARSRWITRASSTRAEGAGTAEIANISGRIPRDRVARTTHAPERRSRWTIVAAEHPDGRRSARKALETIERNARVQQDRRRPPRCVAHHRRAAPLERTVAVPAVVEAAVDSVRQWRQRSPSH